MRGFLHWNWHLDEMHCLFRAVDREDEVLDSYVTKTGDKEAALAFIRKTLKKYESSHKLGQADVILTTLAQFAAFHCRIWWRLAPAFSVSCADKLNPPEPSNTASRRCSVPVISGLSDMVT